MSVTDGQSMRTRRRAAAGLLLVGGLFAGACASSGEVASGPANAPVVADNETDPAALASALHGIETSTTAAGLSAEAAGDLNCKQFSYQEDAQAKLAEDKTDPYKLDGDGNGVACDSLQHKPVQTLPPQTSPPQTVPRTTVTVATTPPTTAAPPPAAAQPSTMTGLTADEQKVVTYVNGFLGMNLIPEVTLFNGARNGATSPPGPVVYPFYASANAKGGGSVDGLLQYLNPNLGNFRNCTHIGVGILADAAGQKINLLCGKF